MIALLLAAGVGRRLGDDRPKVLLEVGGRTLLDRHLENLRKAGIALRVVTGFHSDQIEDALGENAEIVHNAQFRSGSVLSLRCGLEGLDDDVVVMDGDVLYDPTILMDVMHLERGFALDPRTDPGDEEMMIGVRDGKARAIRRGKLAEFELVGEGVGFFKLDRAHIDPLRACIERCDPEGDYEAALDLLIGEHGADYVEVGERPWTEIDFPEDVVRAETEILPKLL